MSSTCLYSESLPHAAAELTLVLIAGPSFPSLGAISAAAGLLHPSLAEQLRPLLEGGEPADLAGIAVQVNLDGLDALRADSASSLLALLRVGLCSEDPATQRIIGEACVKSLYGGR